jgi:hypothetical protein
MTSLKRQPQRGDELLLAHCAIAEDDLRPDAYSRLEEKVGDRLARLLVFALAPVPQGRRGSSSP